MSTSTATAYEYNVAGHLSFGAPKCEKAQKSSGFWANRTYRLCIKDNVLIDPACGSGNFLTETFLCLRRLENKVIEQLLHGQMIFDFAKVSIGQFAGIEINDFAVTVAKTALWIAESQMIKETEEILKQPIGFFPLKTDAKIVEGNALLMDWNDVISKYDLTYIMGNPPFAGASKMNPIQKKELVHVLGKAPRVNSVDYVGAWFHKAADFIQNTNIRCAFVSTNSITQGEQVATFVLAWEVEAVF